MSFLRRSTALPAGVAGQFITEFRHCERIDRFASDRFFAA